MIHTPTEGLYTGKICLIYHLCKFKGLLLYDRYWVKVGEAAVVKYQKFGFKRYKQVKYNIN